MANKKIIGVSPITNTIFYGTANEEKHMWVGQKADVTDMADGAAVRMVYGANEK